MSRLPPARITILGMAAIFLLTSVVGWALTEFADTADTHRHTRQRAEQMAALLEGHVASTYAGSDALIKLVASLTERFGPESVQQRSFFEQMHMAAEGLAQVKAVWVADEHGQVIFSSSVFPPPKFNVTSRPYFTALQAGEKRHWSGLFRSSYYNDIISVDARRLEHADGSFAGVVAASIDSAYFDRAEHGKHFGSAAELVVFRDDGAIVASHPMNENAINKNWGDQPLFAAIRQSPTGTFEGLSPLSDAPGTVSYRAVHGMPLVVVASIPDEEAHAGLAERRLRRTGLMLFPLGAIAALTVLGLAAVRRHEQAAADAHQNAQRLRQALASSPTALIELDCDLRYRSVINAQLPGNHAGKRAKDLFVPACAEGLEGFYRQVLETQQPACAALKLRPQGGVEDVYFETYAEPDYDEAGNLRGVRASSQNITFLVKVTRALRTALIEKDVLFKEVHHRVRNNLQIVASLLTIQSLQAEEPQVRDGIADILDRISSMALVHTLLYQHDDATAVHMQRLLSALGETLAVSHGAPERQIAIEVQADDHRLALEKAVPVALIANEAISNALKHAFPNGRPGRILVSFTQGQGRCLLRVSDDGIGVSQDKFRSGSTGMMLIRGLADQVDGRSRFEQAAGTTFELAFSA